jgi:hypothetical protein
MSVELSNEMMAHWSEIKSLVTALEFDITSNAGGCQKAGRRARRALRDLRNHVSTLSRLSNAKGKAIKAERAAIRGQLDPESSEV